MNFLYQIIHLRKKGEHCTCLCLWICICLSPRLSYTYTIWEKSPELRSIFFAVSIENTKEELIIIVAFIIWLIIKEECVKRVTCKYNHTAHKPHMSNQLHALLCNSFYHYAFYFMRLWPTPKVHQIIKSYVYFLSLYFIPQEPNTFVPSFIRTPLCQEFGNMSDIAMIRFI